MVSSEAPAFRSKDGCALKHYVLKLALSLQILMYKTLIPQTSCKPNLYKITHVVFSRKIIKSCFLNWCKCTAVNMVKIRFLSILLVVTCFLGGVVSITDKQLELSIVFHTVNLLQILHLYVFKNLPLFVFNEAWIRVFHLIFEQSVSFEIL